MQLCPKIQDIGAKNAPVWVFVSYLYITWAVLHECWFCPELVPYYELNVILYNSK